MDVRRLGTLLQRYLHQPGRLRSPFVLHTNDQRQAVSCTRSLLSQCGNQLEINYLNASELSALLNTGRHGSHRVLGALSKNRFHLILGWSRLDSVHDKLKLLSVLLRAEGRSAGVVMHQRDYDAVVASIPEHAQDSTFFKNIGCYTEGYYERHRTRMIAKVTGQQDARTRRRLSRVLSRIPRQLFVPPTFVGLAHRTGNAIQIVCDGDSSVSRIETQVDTVALADIHRGHRVLDVGGGRGYQAAVAAGLANLGGVLSVECVASLVEQANRSFEALGLHNALAVHGNVLELAQRLGQFDRIVVAAGVTQQRHLDALSDLLVHGGKMVAPVSLDRQDCNNLSLTLFWKGRQNLKRIHELPGSYSFVPFVDNREVQEAI